MADRPPSSHNSSYSLDLDALAQAGRLLDTSSSHVSAAWLQQLPLPRVDVLRSDDVDGPSDFTQNMEFWMRRDGKSELRPVQPTEGGEHDSQLVRVFPARGPADATINGLATANTSMQATGYVEELDADSISALSVDLQDGTMLSSPEDEHASEQGSVHGHEGGHSMEHQHDTERDNDEQNDLEKRVNETLDQQMMHELKNESKGMLSDERLSDGR